MVVTNTGVICHVVHHGACRIFSKHGKHGARLILGGVTRGGATGLGARTHGGSSVDIDQPDCIYRPFVPIILVSLFALFPGIGNCLLYFFGRGGVFLLAYGAVGITLSLENATVLQSCIEDLVPGAREGGEEITIAQASGNLEHETILLAIIRLIKSGSSTVHVESRGTDPAGDHVVLEAVQTIQGFLVGTVGIDGVKTGGVRRALGAFSRLCSLAFFFQDVVATFFLAAVPRIAVVFAAFVDGEFGAVRARAFER